MASFRLFKLYLRIPFIVLALIEFVLCFFAVFVAVYARFDGMDLESSSGIDSPLVGAVVFGLVMTLSMMAMGLYQSSFRGGSLGIFLRALIGFVVGAIALAMVYYIFPSLYLGRGVLAISSVLAFFMVGAVRPVYQHYVDQDSIKSRIAVLGVGERAVSVERRLRRRSDRRGFKLVDFLLIDKDEEIKTLRYKELSGMTLLEYCDQYDVDELVVALNDRRNNLPLNELLECKLSGIDVIDVLTFFEREQGKLPLDIMKPDWLIFSDGFNQSMLRDIFKRLFDIVASVSLLMIAWPAMLLAVIAIKLEDGWHASLIYKQIRTGQRNIDFAVLKFRSMSIDAEKDGKAQWASKNDIRVTRVGSFLRRTRIDELPQIINVLIGEMSFVGPRPERPEMITELAKQIPYYSERHRVKPGITGWAQVCYPYGASVEDAVHKQEFDLYYVKNHTLFIDLLILFQTAEVVLFGKGVR